MSHGRGVLALAALACAISVWAGVAHAQSPDDRLSAARTLVRNGEYDSATAMLNPVFQDARTTAAQRSRAFLLSAAALFMKENMVLSNSSRAMLQLSLRADSSVRVDDDLNTDVPGLREPFETLRRDSYLSAAAPTAAPAAPAAPAVVLPPLTVQVDVPADTQLTPLVDRLPVLPRPSRHARVTATVGPIDAPTVVLWSDTLPAGAPDSLGWNLHGRNGNVVPSGRYALRVTATDSLGKVSPTIERVLVVTRAEPDTQPLPSPLAPSAFEPETVRLKRASPTVLLVGAALGAAAALLPEVLARTELTEGRDRDATSLAIAGTAAVAGIVGFLAGHHEQPVPEAVTRNAELRQRDAANRQAITSANAAARANAPVRVRLEASGP